MQANEYKGQVDFELSLKPGDPCFVRWTNCGHCHGGPARVIRRNKASLLTELTEDTGPYFAGHKISVPLLSHFGTGVRRWSAYNCVKASIDD